MIDEKRSVCSRVFAKRRRELELDVRETIRDRMMRSGAIREHSLFIVGRKEERCFYGCKLICAILEANPYMTTPDAEITGRYLFKQGIIVPVVKFVNKFRNSTLLYRFSYDERDMKEVLEMEYRASLEMARKVYSSKAVVPNPISGNVLLVILDSCNHQTNDTLSKPAIQAQLLLVHGLINPLLCRPGDTARWRSSGQELGQKFRSDRKYMFCGEVSSIMEYRKQSSMSRRVSSPGNLARPGPDARRRFSSASSVGEGEEGGRSTLPRGTGVKEETQNIWAAAIPEVPDRPPSFFREESSSYADIDEEEAGYLVIEDCIDVSQVYQPPKHTSNVKQNLSNLIHTTKQTFRGRRRSK